MLIEADDEIVIRSDSTRLRKTRTISPEPTIFPIAIPNRPLPTIAGISVLKEMKTLYKL